MLKSAINWFLLPRWFYFLLKYSSWLGGVVYWCLNYYYLLIKWQMGGWWAGQPTLGSHLPQAQGWKGEDQTQSWDLLSCQYECTCVVELLYTKKVQVSYISVEDHVTLSGAPMSIPSSWRWSCGVAEWISSSGAEIMQGQAPDRRDTSSAPTAATHVSRVWSCSKWKVLGRCCGLCIKQKLLLPLSSFIEYYCL